MKTCHALAAMTGLLMLSAIAAKAEIAVSANDGKQLRPGDTVTTPTPDSIAVLDIVDGRAKVIGSLEMPAAMIGPPASVAISPDGKLAIVTACQSFAGDTLVPADTVSVVDIARPAHPRVLHTLHAAAGASGVSISPDGKLALVANSKDDSISVFSISGKTVTNVGKVALGADTGPTDVVFAPDGKTAIAVAQRSSSLLLLAVDGTTVTLTDKAFAPGRTPYGAVVTRDGRYVINTNLGGALPPAAQTAGLQPASVSDTPKRPRPGGGMSRQGTISMTDLSSGTVVSSIVVGPTPEHVAASADGKYVAVVVANGTASVRSDPKFDTVLGLLEIYAVGDGTLTPVARADTGHWCQGTTFSKDGKTLLLQCAAEREIEVFHFDGTTLVQDKQASIPFVSRPGAIATALSR